jgi:CHAT domain-containing protein/tetratricopeptide (TPR) repeat protein
MRGTSVSFWRSKRGRSLTAVLAVVLIGSVVASGLLVAAVRRSDGWELRRLAEAVGPHRVTRGRLTGGFAYAPCDTVSPNDSLIVGLTCDRTRPDQWPQAHKLTAVAAELRAARARGLGGVSDLHASGGWHVVWGDVDAAVEDLRAAGRSSPTDAGIQSDLAAVLLARAARKQDPQSILEAHTAADSAVALDAKLPEAQFNRAVALEWLCLRNDALSAWESYLELDPRSPWADEARERQRLLRVSLPVWRTAEQTLLAAVGASNDSVASLIARQFPVSTRNEIRLGMLDWARAHGEDLPRADTALMRANTLARALAVGTGDSLWLDAVETVIRATERAQQRRVDETAQGLIAYATAEAYLDKFSPDSAAPRFTEAERVLTVAGSPVRFLATFGSARVAYGKRLFGEAHATLRRIRSTAPNKYHYVRVQAARTQGLIDGTQANFNAAIAGYSVATREATGTGDIGLAIRPRVGLAAHFANLGSPAEGWNHLYTALRMTEHYAEAAVEGGVPTFAMAARLSWSKAPRVASLFQQEAVRLAGLTTSSLRDSLELIGALDRQAELLGRAGRSGEAFEILDKARRYIESITVDSMTAFYTAETDLVEGSVLLGVKPDSALRTLKHVIDSYRHPRYRLELDRALLLFANAYAAVGAMDSAQRAFDQAIAETERRRSTIARPEDRARFLDQARPIIDKVLTFLVTRGDTVGALDFLERMRGRVLLEHVLASSPNDTVMPRPLEALRATLPAGTNVVSYAVLDHELLIWLIRRDGVFLYRQPGPARLEQLATRFASLIAARSTDPELARTGGDLYRLLIAPLEARLDPQSRVIFVPDRWLHFVPFGALFDESSGKFVVEHFETGIAPSLQLYVQSLSRYQRLRASTSLSVLAVGDPAFDGQTRSLPRLPGAATEAKRVAAVYQGAHLLVSDQATKRAFLDYAAESDIVHFAGHAVVRPESPLLSHLVLTPDASGDVSGTLTAQELFETRLPRTRLAILSGCHTGSGELSDTEGASSLARALFAAGVPAVVASLWAVDDAGTAEFFTGYHRRLSRGEDPTSALAGMQREWIARDRGWQGASTWAAFALYGATTSEVRDR